jgi:hypothetical protein
VSGSRAGVVVALVACLALLVGGCADGDGQQADRGEDGLPGHASLRFSGAVTGSLDADVEVACFEPAEEGIPFSVALDTDTGIAVDGKTFQSMDLVVPDYRGPQAYDLGNALESEDGFDGEGLFLLFEEDEEHPFAWGDEESAGTVTIDEGETAGRLSLRGWKNDLGDLVDVEGTFRCGRKPEG